LLRFVEINFPQQDRKNSVGNGLVFCDVEVGFRLGERKWWALLSVWYNRQYTGLKILFSV
jgi:hypothetical protein